MATWKLTVEYDGTRYYGWQEQRNARTVAGELRAAAEAFFSRPVEIAGAGRTDAGVHALAQVARLRTDWRQQRVLWCLIHCFCDRVFLFLFFDGCGGPPSDWCHQRRHSGSRRHGICTVKEGMVN